MAGSVFDSAIRRDLFVDRETAALFTDTAEVRAAMLVIGTLAKIQGAAGVIPADAAGAIHRASMELQIDPAALAANVARGGSLVAPLARAFAKDMQAPDQAAWIMHGTQATAIEDAALALRLRQVLGLAENRLAAAAEALGQRGRSHPELEGAANATRALLPALDDIKTALLVVRLPDPEQATALAKGLGLGTAPAGWPHYEALGNWASAVTATVARATLALPAQVAQATEMRDLADALALSVQHLTSIMRRDPEQSESTARLLRDMSLPQLCLSLGRATALIDTLAKRLASGE